jgi:hypothetical protein
MDSGGRAPEAGASGDAWSHCREGRDEGIGIRKSRCLFDTLCQTPPEGEDLIGKMADQTDFQP